MQEGTEIEGLERLVVRNEKYVYSSGEIFVKERGTDRRSRLRRDDNFKMYLVGGYVGVVG